MQSVASNSCFCVENGLGQKACNCCVSDAQYQQVPPICPANRAASSCKCDSVNGSLNCSCANQYFFNQVSNIMYKPNQCACSASANQTTGIDCQCCTTPDELSPAPVCAVTENFVNCQ